MYQANTKQLQTCTLTNIRKIILKSESITRVYKMMKCSIFFRKFCVVKLFYQ